MKLNVISLAAICVGAATRSNLTYFAEDCDVEGGNRAAIKCTDVAKKRHQNCADDCESEVDDKERQSCRLDCSLKWISDLEDCPCGENCMGGCPCVTEFGAKFCSTASAEEVFMTKQVDKIYIEFILNLYFEVHFKQPKIVRRLHRRS